MERTSHSSTPVKGEAALSSTEKRIYIFEKAPVRRAVLQQMLPTVAGQMVALLYNLADTFFCGPAECTHTDSRRYGSLSPLSDDDCRE